VGKGLPWSVIGEFFLLSIPFTIALTVPMSVLVAVLYAFSRLAAENEVTALKANGVSPWRLVSPALLGWRRDDDRSAGIQRPGAAARQSPAQDAAGRHLADEPALLSRSR
jgi:hypothetical protein